MTIKSIHRFDDFSQKAFEQVAKTSIGKPFRNEKGILIGEIVKATVIGKKTIEFEIQLEVI